MTSWLLIPAYLATLAIFLLWWGAGRGTRENNSRILGPLIRQRETSSDDVRLATVLNDASHGGINSRG